MSDAGLKYFDSPVTKRRVAINPHPADFAWLYLPTKAEFEAVLREHEYIRIQETWKEWSEQDGESWIKGFRDGPNSSLRVLAARAVAERLGFEKFRGVGDELRKLPLNEQRKLLNQCMPTCYEELKALLSPAGLNHAYGQDIRQTFMAVGDVREFVRQMCAYRPEQSDDRRMAGRYSEILLMLRARGWLLFSTAFVHWSASSKWRAAFNPAYAGSVAQLLHEPESVTPIAADLESHRIHLHKGRFPVLAPDLSFNA